MKTQRTLTVVVHYELDNDLTPLELDEEIAQLERNLAYMPDYFANGCRFNQDTTAEVDDVSCSVSAP
jgi:hypothetical protein